MYYAARLPTTLPWLAALRGRRKGAPVPERARDGAAQAVKNGASRRRAAKTKPLACRWPRRAATTPQVACSEKQMIKVAMILFWLTAIKRSLAAHKNTPNNLTCAPAAAPPRPGRRPRPVLERKRGRKGWPWHETLLLERFKKPALITHVNDSPQPWCPCVRLEERWGPARRVAIEKQRVLDASGPCCFIPAACHAGKRRAR